MNHNTPNIRTEQCNIHPALRSLIRHIVIIEADFGNIPVSIAGNYMPSPDQAMFINLYTRLKSKKSGEKNFNTVSSCTLIGPQITPFNSWYRKDIQPYQLFFNQEG